MPIIKMPNGDNVRFPDNISPDQIDAFVSEQFPEEFKADNAILKKENRLNILQRLDKDFGERVGKANKAQVLMEQGKISNPSAFIRQGTSIAGALTDIPKELGVSAFRGIDDMTGNAISDTATKAGKAVANTGIGKAGLQGFGKFMQGYGRFAENHPEIATNIGSVGDFASLLGGDALGGFKGSKTAIKSAVAAKDASVRAAKDTTKAVTTKKIYPTLDKIKNVSQKYYDKADELGVEVNPSVINDALRPFMKDLPRDEFGIRNAGKTTKEMMQYIQDALPQDGERLSFSTVMDMDKELTRRAYSSAVSDPALSRFYKGVQSEMRSILDRGGDDIMTGSTAEAAQYAKEARKLWSAQAKIRDIENILEMADTYQVPATAIKTGFRALERNKKAFNSYSPEAKRAIKKAARTGNAEKLLNVMGIRLNAIGGGAAGGPIGALGGFAISEIGRGGSEAIKRGQGDILSNIIKESTGLVREVPRFTNKAGLKKFLESQKPSIQQEQPIPIAGLLEAPKPPKQGYFLGDEMGNNAYMRPDNLPNELGIDNSTQLNLLKKLQELNSDRGKKVGIVIDEIDIMNRPAASWVFVDKETGKGVFETHEKDVAKQANFEKYNVIPAGKYLVSLNKKDQK